MKFSNAYELFKTLYDLNLLKGFYINQVFMFYGSTFEFEIDTKIQEPKFINLAEEIFNGWCDHSQKANCYPSNYDCKLYNNDKDDLSISIDVIHDLCEYHCDENITDDILQIIVKELSLEKMIDEDEDLDFQFNLSFKLEIDNFVGSKYNLSLFQINSSHDEVKIALKINNTINAKIKSVGLENLQKSIIGYFRNLHDGNSDYHGICIEIEDNNINTFQGYGTDVDENLKEFLLDYPLKFALDLNKIQRNLKL